MTRTASLLILTVCGAVLAFAPESALSASDVATFDSFYSKSWSMSPWAWALAAAAAIAAAAAVFFFAPVAGPAVATVGTWLGGMFGFSGVAATNFGLALLGGGSLASGGFGMLGGTILLTAAFAFTTDVAVDFAAGKAVEKYQYSKFVDSSRDMVTLPLPRNDKGPKSYKEAMELLEHIEQGAPLTSPDNRAVIIAAIASMQDPTESLDSDDAVRRRSMLALLNFIAGEYKTARVHAAEALNLGQATRGETTLPAFVHATALLYEPTIDHDQSLDALRYSIVNEPDNPLIPLMFAVYLDRLTYRFNDGSARINDLDRVAAIAMELELDDHGMASQVVVSGRYITRLYLAQQQIASLAQSKNRTIRSNPKTLHQVQAAFVDYQTLLTGMRTNVSPISMLTEVATETEAPTRLSDVWEKYCQDQGRLWGLLQELARDQETAGRRSPASQAILRGAQPTPVACAEGSSAEISDANVAEMLRLADLEYESDEESDFQVRVDLSDGRSQRVFITSETAEDDALVMPDIWSLAYATEEPLSAEMASRLQQQNGELIMGAWHVVEDDGETFVLFGAPMPVNIGAAALRQAIEIVAVKADELEEQMTRRDEY